MALNTHSLDLQGGTQYVNFGDVLFDSLSACTWEYWINLDTLPSGNSFYLMQKWQGVANQACFIQRYQDASGTLTFYFFFANATTDGGSNYATFALTLSTGTWYHLAWVFDGAGGTNADRLKFYTATDSDSAHTQRTLTFGGTIPATTTSSTSSFRFGNASGDPSLDGKTDDWRVWNTARTSTQLDNNFKTQLVGNESGLIGYWKLNDGSGTNCDDSTSTNDGTITNGSATWSTTVPFPGSADSAGAILTPSKVW